jgi:hypothetical protein
MAAVPLIDDMEEHVGGVGAVGSDSMKAYLVTTATVFGLLVAIHVWRVFEEPHLVRDVWYLLVTAVSAAFCVWACRLLSGAPRS